MNKGSLILAIVLTLAATAGLSAWCFSSGRYVLGAVNAAMALVNVMILIIRLTR